MIRRAGAADAAALARLAAVTFPLACPPHTTDEAKADFIATHLSEERFAEYLADPARTLHIAGPGEAPVGYSMLVAGDPADPDVAAAVSHRPTIELSKFYLHADAQGTGVAGLLMAVTLRAARQAGAASAWLGVNEENARAHRFYAKHGFAAVGRKRFLVGDRFEDDDVLEVVF